MNRGISTLIVLLILADAFFKIYIARFDVFQSHYHTILTVSALILAVCSILLFHLLTQEKNLRNGLIDSAQVEKKQWLIIFCIVLIAAVVRFWKLDSLFEGLFLDEAYNGLDGIAIRDFGQRPFFLAWNSGREALVAYLCALSTFIFGKTGFAIRAVQASAGTLSVIFVYFLVRKLFTERLALLTAFLLAISKYAIIYNRFGLRMNLMLLFETASLCFLAYAMKTEKPRYSFFLLAGIAAGLGFHSYIPYRIFPLTWLAFLLDPGIRANIRTRWKGLAASALVCFLITAPLLYHFAKNPEDFSGRMKKTAAWTNPKQSVAQSLLYSTRDTLALFTFRSDPNPRHNVEGEPGLSPFSTAFFILGLIVCIVNIKKNYSPFLLAYFLITILPGILGAAAPHASRNLGALPVALIFTSIGILSTLKFVTNKPLRTTVLAAILAGNFLTGINDALFRYSAILDAQGPETTALWGMDSTETALATYLKSLGSRCQAYLTPQFYFHATVEYLTYSKSTHLLLASNTVFAPGKINLVVMELEPRNLWWMRDDDDKNFFHWWAERGGQRVPFIRSEIRKAYINYPRTMNMSDQLILRRLTQTHPNGRLIHFNQFSVFLF